MNRHAFPLSFSRLLQYCLGLGMAMLLSACGGGGGTVGLPTGTALYTNAPGALTLAAGASADYAIGGGTPTYTAASSNRDIITASVSGTSLHIVGVAGGSATISVTDQAGASSSVSVTVTAAPVTPAPQPGVLFTTAAGTVTVGTGANAIYGIGGGKAPYAVSSSNASVASATISGGNFTVSGIAPGAAQIVVTDAAGVSLSVAVTVGSGTPTPLYTTSPSGVTVAVGASASYAVGGGKPVYTVSSSNNAVAKVAASGSDFIITGISPGSAQVAVVDAAGTALSIDVTVGTGGTVTALFITAPGNVTIQPGITANYTIGGGKPAYAVSSSNTAVAQVGISGSSFIVTGGQAGSAQVAVSDASGTMLTFSVTVGSAGPGTTLFSTAPSTVSLAVGATETYSVNGGTAPYAVSSSNSAAATVTISGKTFVVTGASAGSAQISVFDAAGSSVATTVTVGATAADKPLFTTAPPEISMALGEDETFTLGGGKPPYAATSSNGTVAKVAIIGGSYTITGLTAGSAKIVLSDASGQTPISLAITVGTGTGATPLYTTAPDTITLTSGSADSFIVAGGKAPYSVSTGNAAVAKIVVIGNDFTISGIGPGTASVLVFDSAGAKQTITVTVPGAAPGAALFTTAPGAVSLGVGTGASYTVSGGSGAYSATSGTPSVATASMAGGTLTISAVAAGTAKINVTDSAGASVQIDVTVTQTPPPIIVLLPGSATGNVGDTLTFIVRGGTPGYTISINNTAIATVAPASVAASGDTFSVALRNVGTTVATVTDTLGQTTSLPITAEQTSTTLRLSPNALLVGENDLSPIVLNIYGGTGPYRAFTSDQTLTSVSTSGSTLTIGVGSNGSRCIASIAADGTYTPFGTFDVTITTLDSLGASATSVLTIKDNGKGLNIGCP